jgi:hypothetical protein
LHRASEVTNLRRGHDLLVPLALKEDLEADEWVDLKCAIPVNAAVTRAARNNHLHEAGFPKEALAEPLEAVWWKGEKQFKKPFPVAKGRERNLLLRLFFGRWLLILAAPALLREGLAPLEVDLTGLFGRETGVTRPLCEAPYSPPRSVQ